MSEPAVTVTLPISMRVILSVPEAAITLATVSPELPFSAKVSESFPVAIDTVLSAATGVPPTALNTTLYSPRARSMVAHFAFSIVGVLPTFALAPVRVASTTTKPEIPNEPPVVSPIPADVTRFQVPVDSHTVPVSPKS